MRYYCPECKTEIITCPRDTECLYCGTRMIQLPDFETPEQYEKRTGEKWNGAIWMRCNNDCGEVCGNKKIWNVYKGVERAEIEICYDWKYLNGNDVDYVCANSPEPPPDNWKPHRMGELKPISQFKDRILNKKYRYAITVLRVIAGRSEKTKDGSWNEWTEAEAFRDCRSAAISCLKYLGGLPKEDIPINESLIAVVCKNKPCNKKSCEGCTEFLCGF